MVIPDFTTANLLVVGDVMLDTYWQGIVKRISPEAPVQIVNIQSQDFKAGGASNVALNAQKLGVQTTLIGVIGNDIPGEQLKSLLSIQGVNCCLTPIEGYKTINKLRILSQNQQLIRLDFEDLLFEIDDKQLIDDVELHLQNVDGIILSDYAKGSLKSPQQIISKAKEFNKFVIVDPKGIDFERYKGASLITPNFTEFQLVVGDCYTEKDIVDKGTLICDKLNLQAILITRGEYGMTLIEKDEEPLHLPTEALEVYDVTGAGDTVIATLGACLASGLKLRDAVKLSNFAAGIVVGKVGTATVTKDDLLFNHY